MADIEFLDGIMASPFAVLEDAKNRINDKSKILVLWIDDDGFHWSSSCTNEQAAWMCARMTKEVI